MKFDLGKLTMTRGMFERISDDPEFGKFVANSLARYKNGDWGDTSTSDSHNNDRAVDLGERILAVYIFNKDTDDKIWIITEWDRSATTILFPSEY